MGRKIPGKKHRTPVDPEKQRQKRDESEKNKINNPPQNPTEQEIPRSVLEIMDLKKKSLGHGGESLRKKVRKKRRKDRLLKMEQFLDKDVTQPGMSRPDRFIPNLTQRNEETPEKFLGRVNALAQRVIKEVQFEDKFNVSIKKDLKTGKIIKIEKDKFNRIKKSKKKTLSEKRKEKAANRVKQDDSKDFSSLVDKVEFGEVVHRPPVELKFNNKLNRITSIKKKEGKYKNLLLQDIFSGGKSNVVNVR